MRITPIVIHLPIFQAKKGAFGMFPRLSGIDFGIVVEAGKDNRPVDFLSLRGKPRVQNLSSALASPIVLIADVEVVPDFTSIVVESGYPPVGALIFTENGPAVMALIGEEEHLETACFSIESGNEIEIKGHPSICAKKWQISIRDVLSAQTVVSIIVP